MTTTGQISLIAGLAVGIGTSTLVFIVGSGELSLGMLFLPVMIVSVLLLRGKLAYPHKRLWLLVSIVLIASVLSPSEQRSSAIAQAITMATIIWTFAIVAPLLDEHKIWKVVSIFLILSIVASLYQLIGLEEERAWGINGNPNVTATLALVVLPIAPWWGSLSSVWLIAVSGSRVPFVLAGIFLILKGRPLLAAALMGFAILSMGLWGTYDRLSDGTLSGIVESSERINTFQRSLENISDKPFIGQGLTFGRESEKTSPPNMYLQLIQDMGIPFGFAFIGILFYITWKARGASQWQLIGILLIGMFYGQIFVSSLGYFMLAPILVMATRRKEDAKKAESPQPGYSEHSRQET